MLCKKCGNNVKSDFKYCPYCGERIVSDFHDHYEELTPPFLVREPDRARTLRRTGTPQRRGSGAPDFALPPTAAPEEPPLAPGAFPQEDLEDDLAPPHFRVSLPEEPAPGGYGGPLFGADGPPASGRYAAPAGFEPVDDPAGPSEAPYFVYRPEPAARFPGTDPAGETPSAPPAREIPRRGADQAEGGPGHRGQAADHRGGADRRGSGVLVRIPPAGRRTRALPEYRLFSDVCAGLRSVNI